MPAASLHSCSVERPGRGWNMSAHGGRVARRAMALITGSAFLALGLTSCASGSADDIDLQADDTYVQHVRDSSGTEVWPDDETLIDAARYTCTVLADEDDPAAVGIRMFGKARELGMTGKQWGAAVKYGVPVYCPESKSAAVAMAEAWQQGSATAG